MNLRVVTGDLLDQDVEVIVNAWNRNLFPWWLLLPQGVSGAIKRRAGKARKREARSLVHEHDESPPRIAASIRR